MAKSAFRALQIMESVAQCKTGATHTAIAAGLGIPKSSLSGLLRDLETPGYLQLDEASGRYSIGPQVMFLSNAYLRNLNIVREGAPFVHRMFVELNEFSSLALPKGGEMFIVCAENSPSPLAHSLNIGEHLPILANSTGRAFLAFLDDDEIDQFLAQHRLVAYTKNPVTRIKDLRAILRRVREAGIAHAREDAAKPVRAARRRSRYGCALIALPRSFHRTTFATRRERGPWHRSCTSSFRYAR